MNAQVNTVELETKVKQMYEDVAENPHGDFHFEMGREMAERLGYDPALLDRVPAESIESFAGVGHHFDLAELRPGETVLDLGSGSGLDTFVAARQVGETGTVIGIDMTEAQRRKAEHLRDRDGFRNVRYAPGYIEALPVPDASVDCVISNGVINLSADKGRVFREAARVLRSGGRLALSDITTDVPLPEGIVCNATLWAACIGGAMQRDDYASLVEDAGLKLVAMKKNTAYRFLSSNAKGAAAKYGVESLSLVALKT